MNNLLLGVQKSPDYIVKNIKKAPNLFDLNNNIKLKMLEKDVEMQRKYLSEVHALKDSNDANNRSNNNKNFNNVNNNFNNDRNINFNNFEKNFTNTHITITNQTNFLKETINSILDESLSTQKVKGKSQNENSKINNSKANELENNFFDEGNKNLNFDFDESQDINASQSTTKKNKKGKDELMQLSGKRSKMDHESGKQRIRNIKNKLENFGYLSSGSESEGFHKNANYDSYKNLSKNELP